VFDAFPNRRDILLVIAVDEDVALRRGHEIDSKVGGADIVEVARNLEAGNSAMKVGIALRACRERQEDADRDQENSDPDSSAHKGLLACQSAVSVTLACGRPYNHPPHGDRPG